MCIVCRPIEAATPGNRKKEVRNTDSRFSALAGQLSCTPVTSESILQYFQPSFSYHLSLKSVLLSIFEWPLKTGFAVTENPILAASSCTHMRMRRYAPVVCVPIASMWSLICDCSVS